MLIRTSCILKLRNSLFLNFSISYFQTQAIETTGSETTWKEELTFSLYYPRSLSYLPVVWHLTQLPCWNGYSWDSGGIYVVKYIWNFLIIILFYLIAIFSTSDHFLLFETLHSCSLMLLSPIFSPNLINNSFIVSYLILFLPDLWILIFKIWVLVFIFSNTTSLNNQSPLVLVSSIFILIVAQARKPEILFILFLFLSKFISKSVNAFPQIHYKSVISLYLHH